MRFENYLKEAEMTVADALKIFGISADQIGDKIGLKRTYRRLSKQNHPDIGGSEENAKKINVAYEILSKANKKDVEVKTSMQNWKERQEKEKAMADSLRQSLLSDFHPELYQRYFKEQGGYDFHYEITKTRQGWPGFEVEFFTKDRKTIFTLKVHADITDIIRGGLGGGEEFSYTLYTEAYGFHLNKKQKMSKSDWGFTRDHSFLSKPEKLFPKKKMKAIFSGKTSARKFAKRDMIAYLKDKLKSDWDGEFAAIPLGDDYFLMVFRSTFMRKGTWGINGIYQQKSKYTKARVAQPRFVSFLEEEETAKIFDKIQKEVIKVKGEAKIKKTEKLLKLAYEAYKKAKGI